MTKSLLFCLACAQLAGGVSAATVHNLRCEYLKDPLGIDAAKPSLSWVIKSDRRGEIQTAYQVLVASRAELLAADKGDLWDSGKVASDQTNQVEYLGKPLHSRAQCFWKAHIWDKDGKPSAWSERAEWSMGLLQPEDWRAKWIGAEQSGSTEALAPGPLRIIRAMYQPVSGTPARDVTELLARKVSGNTLAITVNNATLGGDPAYGMKKKLIVEYELAGKRHQQTAAEDERLSINIESPMEWAKPRYLRKSFTLDRAVRRATVYATALGLYELRLNGERVGDHLLAPEWTNYHKRVQYQTYDVTAMVRSGPNALAAVLGNGWYCGGWQFWQDKLKAIYGTEPYLLVQLEIESADGSRQTIESDGSWRGTTDGPLQFAGIYEGVTYDARKEMPGWDAPGFDDAKWKKAQSAAADLRIGQLVWQRDEPIRVTQELAAVRVTEPKPGVFVFDLGQNIAGWCRLQVREEAGTEITLLHNEVLNPDGTVYMDNLHAGRLSSGDRQIDRYICAGGGPETFEPNFTYHGFRYVEAHGLRSKPEASALTGRVFHSAFAPAGEFVCSNPLINRLVQNIQWSQRGNMMGIPTDCCQRDERCGYTGDANFFMGAAVYNFDVAAFFNKWLVDLCQDSQLPGGWFADHAPYYGPGPGPNVGWSDGGIICPYRVYRTYGDTRILREHYAAMKRCIEWQIQTANADGTRGPGVGNGDWLNLGGGASDEVIMTTHYAYSLKLMAEMGEAIGQREDAAKYRAQAEKAAAAFAKYLVEPDGRIKNSSQTGYALAFTMDLVPAELKAKMAKCFGDEIQRFKNHLATGFIGTPRLLPGLHMAGRDDLAYRLLLNEDFPSWLFEVKNNATTVWERWDGWRPEAGFQDSGMNSFNHYSFGAVGEYLFRIIGGISEDAPGYRRIRIAPAPGAGLDWAKTSYDCIHGRIVSSWKRDGEKLTLEVMIPANTTATVFVPAKEASSVTEGGKPIDKAEGVRFLRMEGSCAVYEIGSGHYAFESTLPVSPARITVAAYYYPCTHPDPRWDKAKYAGFTEWDLIKAAKQRFPGHKQPKVPVWGYTDESRPEAMEQKIAAAADHGVDAFIFDWYYYDDGPYLEGALDKGFLKAANNARVKFALMWANHDWYDIQGYNPADKIKLLYPGKVKPETWDTICDLVISKYFKHPSYWKIAGKPYFSIYEMSLFLDSFGSVESARAALDKFRGKARAAGFPGLHANAILWGQPNLPGGKTPADWPKLCRDLGLDSLTGYTWVHHGALDYTTFPVSDYVKGRETYLRFWAGAATKYPIPYFPNAMIAWDNSPRAAAAADWSKPGAHVVNPVVVGNTPQAFRESLEIIKARLLAASTQPKVITINAWNEWPEGSCLEPEKEYGYGYLEAVKAVFGQ
jgi:alpha-L-rhamnosidase